MIVIWFDIGHRCFESIRNNYVPVCSVDIIISVWERISDISASGNQLR